MTCRSPSRSEVLRASLETILFGDPAESGGGVALQQEGHCRTVIKEGKQAVKMTRLSCHRFRSNEVRLWLSVIAYKLGKSVTAADFATEDRELVLDESPAAAGEDRRPAGEKHPRYYWLLLAESHVTRRLFGRMR